MTAAPPVDFALRRSWARLAAFLMFVSPWVLASWAILSWTSLGWVLAVLLGLAVAVVFATVAALVFLYITIARR